MEEQPSDRLVICTGVIGPAVLKRLKPGEPDPSPEDLALVESRLRAIGGIRPKVRIVNRSRYVPPPEEPAA